MNKKAILKELIKDPQIKALYNEGFDRSVVNKLIIESLTEQATSRPPSKQDISQINDIAILDKISKQWKDTQANDLIAADKHRLEDLKKNISIRKREILRSPKKQKKLAQKVPTQKVPTQKVPATKQPISPEAKLKSTLNKIVKAKLEAIAKKYQKKVDDKKAELEAQKLTDSIVDNIVEKEPELAPEELKNKFQTTMNLFFDNSGEEKTEKIANTIADEPEQPKVEPNNNTKVSPFDQVRRAFAQAKSLEKIRTHNYFSYASTIPFSNQEEAKEVTNELSKAVDSNKNLSNEEKAEIKDDIFQLAAKRLEKVSVESATFPDYKKMLESDEMKKVKEVFEKIKEMFEAKPEAQTTNDLDLSSLKVDLSLTEEEEQTVKISMRWLYALMGDIKNAIKGESYMLRDIFLEMYKLIFNFEQKVAKLYPIVLKNPEKEKQALAVVNNQKNEIIKLQQKLLPVRTDTTQDDDDLTDKAKEKPEQKPSFIAREAFDDAFAPVADAFYDYEEVFETTPFLSEQSRVLFKLEDKLRAFVSSTKDMQGSLGNKSDVKRDQDIQENNNPEQTETKKMIFDQHIPMSNTLKELLALIKSLNEENITTMLGMNIRKKARLKAKELMEKLIVVRNSLGSLSGEEEETIMFKEEQEQKQSPSDHVKRAHAQIMSHMTKMERITRDDKKTQVNYEKYITIPSDEVLKYIEEISPYFPTKAPFGKTGDLAEIKRQVRGIGLDVVDIVKKIKGTIFSKKLKPANIDALDKLVLKSIGLIGKYFDLDVTDPEVRKLLPPKPKSNAAAFNDGAADLKAKIDDIVEKYGPKVKKVYEKAEGSVKKPQVLEKFNNFFAKKVGEIYKKSRTKVNKKQQQVVVNKMMKDVIGDTIQDVINKTPYERFADLSRQGKMNKISQISFKGINSLDKLAEKIVNSVFGETNKKSFGDRIKSLFKEQDGNEKLEYDLLDRGGAEFTDSGIFDKIIKLLDSSYEKDDARTTAKNGIVKILNTVQHGSEPLQDMEDSAKLTAEFSYYFQNYPKLYLLQQDKIKNNNSNEDEEDTEVDWDQVIQSSDSSTPKRSADPRDYWEDDDSEDWLRLEESKNKKIQTKLETIIENYINQRKL